MNVVRPSFEQTLDQLCNAGATVSSIVHGTNVARSRRQIAPIHIEQIVTATLQIF